MPHIHYAYDFVVGAFIVHRGRVLLVHHRKLEVWLCPGGHVELDEDPEQAVHREVLEETGLEVVLDGQRAEYRDPLARSLVRPDWVDVHLINEVHKHVGLFWAAAPLAPDPRPVLAPEEHHAIDWFGPEAFPNLMWESTRYYAREAIRLAGRYKRWP
jgi:8-oxo-dGTP pyrophosphatase MutT (NUDIX family)